MPQASTSNVAHGQAPSTHAAPRQSSDCPDRAVSWHPACQLSALRASWRPTWRLQSAPAAAGQQRRLPALLPWLARHAAPPPPHPQALLLLLPPWLPQGLCCGAGRGWGCPASQQSRPLRRPQQRTLQLLLQRQDHPHCRPHARRRLAPGAAAAAAVLPPPPLLWLQQYCRQQQQQCRPLPCCCRPRRSGTGQQRRCLRSAGAPSWPPAR